MKKVLLFFLSLLLPVCVFAQTNSRSESKGVILSQRDSLLFDYIQQRDSIMLEHIHFIALQSAMTVPRYKIYKTENTYNLIELDTATGALWQVQYEMNNNSDAMKVAINETSLLYSWDEIHSGRFELYPTNNMYTFILVDTEKGYTYQVQWSTNPKQRFRMRIY